jgi:rhamnogalacturonyl hydrolase YesR
MEAYFDSDRAIAGFSGGKIETVLAVMAGRYLGANPRYDYTGRPFINRGIIRNKDYRYEADFGKIFPDAPNGTYVYAWGKYRAEAEGELKFTLIPKGPVKIWMNGATIYGTGVEAERHGNTPVSFNLPVKKGWNHLVLRFTRTRAGFGAEFGTWLGKLDYYFFRGADLPGLPEIEGFDYTLPLAATLEDPSPEQLLPLCAAMPDWTEEEKKRGVFGRIFGREGTGEARPGDFVLARTEFYVPIPTTCVFTGTQTGKCAVYAGKTLIRSLPEPGPFRFECALEAGCTLISVISEYTAEKSWDLVLQADSLSGNGAVPPCSANPFFPANPFSAGGCGFSWIYAGPFRNSPRDRLLEFDRERLPGEGEEKTWWRIDMPGGWVRLYNENPLYGHWNYPLGVTLYGLVETARFFEKQRKEPFGSAGASIGSYVQDHAAKSVRTLEYALFDKEHFGGATAVHHLLSSIDSLDDCGSFGSLILETARDRDIGDLGAAVDYTGDHMLHRQDRLPEGCFYRRKQMHRFHNGTMWADDLYMSVPFLCRYAAYKKDPAILDTAALQFEGFKKYLYMEQAHLMAHVYDFERNMNTGVPWGRGNGWTIFSLSELLMVLPEDHPRRPFLLEFFRDLAAGYLACQDENGMWRQVLNMPSAYVETSCTAMFICAFSRGLRFGWLNSGSGLPDPSCAAFPGDAALYRIAAEKAWKALERYSIDKNGNVYGVCRGSEFSFNPRYYAEHLLPRLNDTHGIGIVLLAGVELLKLRESRGPAA